MKARIVSFRRSKERTYDNQMILESDELDDREDAASLEGSKVIYDTGKKEIEGEIRSAHGNSGALRALFKTGMPGQSLGSEVEIEG